jgi:outer membrane lipoprotein SlyB
MTIDTPLLLGVFPNRELAEGAIDELGHAGYTDKEIGILMPGGTVEQIETPTHHREEVAAQGAETGALAGGSLGILAGALAVAAIPGIGLAVTGGMFTILAGATAAGAALGAFAGPFVAMGLSEEEAKNYEDEFRVGRTIVAVQVHDHDHLDEVVTLLRSHGAITVKTRDGRILAPMELVAG